LPPNSNKKLGHARGTTLNINESRAAQKLNRTTLPPPKGPPLIEVAMRLDNKKQGPFITTMKAILDTGSERTIMTSIYAKAVLGPKFDKEIQSVNLVLRSVTGSKLSIKGCVDVEMAIGVALIKHKIVVINDPKNEIII
jgi:hypothetical protein